MSGAWVTLAHMSTTSDIRAVLHQLDIEIADAEKRLEDLRVERRGAEALLARLPAAKTGIRTPSAARQGAGSGNTEIVAAILADAHEGLYLRSIEAATQERGTPLDYDQIRSAVTYLRRRGEAERVGRGVWRLLSSTDRESPDAPGLSILPAPQPVESGTG
jgi:hypothetical protein